VVEPASAVITKADEAIAVDEEGAADEVVEVEDEEARRGLDDTTVGRTESNFGILHRRKQDTPGWRIWNIKENRHVLAGHHEVLVFSHDNETKRKEIGMKISPSFICIF
jgi:hypothetical protein